MRNARGFDEDFTARGARYMLRRVCAQDAEALMECYSGAHALLAFNDDNCYRGFYAHDVSMLGAQIAFWLNDMRKQSYVRFAIVYIATGAPVGTIEIFNRGALDERSNAGVLRLDTAPAHSSPGALEELLDLCLARLFGAFGLEHVLIKAAPAYTALTRALALTGYTPLKPSDALRFNDWYIADVNALRQNAIERYWRAFLRATGRPEHTRCIDVDQFDLTPESADYLLGLVLEGKKRATASSAEAYIVELGRLPGPGDLSIVLDGAGAPACVIMTTSVLVKPFNEFTFEIVRREGEDECLETWQENHRRFFTEDAVTSGYEFSETMPVAFEDFECVYTARDYERAPGDDSPYDAKTLEYTRAAMDAVLAFAREVERVLGEKLKSAYMTGSAASGAFAPGYSDLDFFFVSARPLTRADFDGLNALYNEYRARGDAYFSALEGEIVYYGALRARDAYQAVYWGGSGDRLSDRWTLSGFGLMGLIKNGALVLGDDIVYELERPRDDDMRAQARRLLISAREHGVNGGSGAHAADWLFLIAQTLYCIYTGDITSKPRAARHLIARDPDSVIAPALRAALEMRAAPQRAQTPEGAAFLRGVGASVRLAADELERAMIARYGA